MLKTCGAGSLAGTVSPRNSMRCDKCHTNEAVIQFTPVVDGKPQKTVNLCKSCTPDYPNAKNFQVEAIYRRVTPEQFARAQSDAKTAESFFASNLSWEELLEIGRAQVRELEESTDPVELLARRKEQEADVPYLFMGTYWHALHFLLTGDSELKPHPLPPPPLGNVVLGGTETPWLCTGGHVRSLTPDEVRAIADALAKISVEQLRSRFSVASFNAARISHPGLARWTDEDAESVLAIYPRVVEFFRSAALAGDMILVSFL